MQAAEETALLLEPGGKALGSSNVHDTLKEAGRTVQGQYLMASCDSRLYVSALLREEDSKWAQKHRSEKLQGLCRLQLGLQLPSSTAATTGLWFQFALRTVLIIQRSFNYC